jgi:hypothetical protein
MTSPIDVLAVVDECIAAQSDAGANWAHERLPEARTAIAELIEAAGDYFARYCQDEATDDGVDFTGCTQEQHLDAIRLRAALARVGGAK